MTINLSVFKSVFIGAFLFGFLVVSQAEATPANKRAFERHMGPLFDAQLNNCATCHVHAEAAEGAHTLEDFPHNVFGEQLRAVKEVWKKEGKRAPFGERLIFVAKEDADGDGVSNLDEILMGRKPGDAKDFPDEKEKAQINARAELFATYLDRYPWSPFEAVKRPPVPKVKKENQHWVRNEIDAFLLAEQEVRGLSPRGEAHKEVWLRRVHLDLTGLAPTPEELRNFLSDKSEEAHDKVIDHLLQSPAYGERWGRHWMDIWRYADWGGYKKAVRFSQPHIWRWRDWIVEAMNEDKSYDRMIVEMLAADEAAPEDEQALRATGYLVRNFHGGSPQ